MSEHGTWVHTVRHAPEHKCVLPDAMAIWVNGAQPGSIWACHKCKQYWEFTAWIDHGHDTMPGESQRTPEWRKV